MNKKIEAFETFVTKHQSAFKEPVLRQFMEQKENRERLIDCVHAPAENKARNIDETFKQFFIKKKTYRYMKTLIKTCAVDFDKRRTQHQQRFPLIADQPLYEEETGTDISMIDMLQSYEPDYVEEILDKESDIEEHIQSSQVVKAVKNLSNKQKDILALLYIYRYTNREAARIFGESPQNISKQHLQALAKIRKRLALRD
ncbi:RNA polymerase sigma factor, sigma-70 family [Alteribacillus persepolensis]|uniref:RNA polymerase sigma factor, sigma-70 family n=1 Tax=Alteribacillus persepolensis TaxID=568899 RepID=A0A1G8AUZ8_9BACI|nr:sigma-70 family RNA polymerase sigma factor [Alteribacillus persepolensis]SDH24190.1 RNA polymerase sigma factor, sigma-70 family [Alteribacillus persepolensis]